MNNEIRHLKNGDFEVMPMKMFNGKPTMRSIAIVDADQCKTTPPTLGAKAVYWVVRGQFGLRWEHKGWLMPQVTS